MKLSIQAFKQGSEVPGITAERTDQQAVAKGQ
jgi:hypothetical protein